MNRKLFHEWRLPVTIDELIATLSCFNTENCMIGECSKCSSTKFINDNFNTRSTPDSDSPSPGDVTDVEGGDENVAENFT